MSTAYHWFLTGFYILAQCIVSAACIVECCKTKYRLEFGLIASASAVFVVRYITNATYAYITQPLLKNLVWYFSALTEVPFTLLYLVGFSMLVAGLIKQRGQTFEARV